MSILSLLPYKVDMLLIELPCPILSFSCSCMNSRAADAVQHFHLYWREDHFAFGHGTYDNVEELAEHFDNKPLLGGESGQYIQLS